MSVLNNIFRILKHYNDSVHSIIQRWKNKFIQALTISKDFIRFFFPREFYNLKKVSQQTGCELTNQSVQT